MNVKIFFNKICEMKHNEQGNFAIFFALLLIPLMGAIALIVDFTRAVQIKSDYQNYLDSAVLSAASKMQEGSGSTDAINYATTMFESNFSTTTASHTLDLEIDDKKKTVSGSADASFETLFAQVIGFNFMNIAVNSQANYGNTTTIPVDLGIMLDVSGSMNYDGKLVGLKSAVTDLLNEIIGSGNTSDTVRVAFAPFSSSVNAGTYASTLIGRTSTTNCIGERTGSDSYTDARPRSNMFDVDGYFAISSDENDGVYRDVHFSGYTVPGLDALDVSTLCPPAEIQPLTGDYTGLIAKLSTYNAAGITAGHLGVAWAWYLISEDWRSFWPAESQPALDSERTKAVILMSDGEFNTYFQSSNNLPDLQTYEICKNMDRENVMVFSVSLGDTGASETFLRRCASEPDYFYDAATAGDLSAAFLSIAEKLQTYGYPTLIH